MSIVMPMPQSASNADHPGSPSTRHLGNLGEQLVANWLSQRGWQVVGQQWHCRWGELDLVAVSAPQDCLAFVEVKTRRSGNWDELGALAITPRKQAKLWKAAELFLLAHPDWAELPGRFDVALVQCEKLVGWQSMGHAPDEQAVLIADGYRLTLQDYIVAAFEG